MAQAAWQPARSHWRPALEMAVFVLALAIVNRSAAPLDPAFRSLQPHPYLIGIALLASFYGLADGLIAAIIASAALLVQLLLQTDDSLAMLLRDGVIRGDLLWFLGTGYLLGAIRRVHAEQFEELAQRLQDSRRDIRMLEERFQAVNTAKTELERRIIGQTASVHSLYEAVKALESLDRSALEPALLHVAASFTGAERCSLFLAEQSSHRLRLAHTYGQPMPDETLTIADDRGVLGMAASQRRAVAVTELQRADRPGAPLELAEHPSLLAAPLVVGGRLYGVISIEAIAFEQMTLSTVRILGMLSELASAAIDNALAHEQVSAERPVNPETHLFRYSYAVKRLSEECVRSHRYRLPTSVLLVSWSAGLVGLEEAARRKPQLMDEVYRALQAQTRSVDLIAHGDRPGEFLVVLPLTDVAGSLVTANRMQLALEAITHDQGPARRWLIGVGSVRNGESAQAIQERLRAAVDDAGRRPQESAIVAAQ